MKTDAHFQLVYKIEQARDMLTVIKIAAQQIALGDLEDETGAAKGIASIAEQIFVHLADTIDAFEESTNKTVTIAALRG